MASLTGQLVAETYKALLKTIDNDILTASEKQITDGFGGGSNVFIDSQGFLRANKYKVTNGLATQFLKADGSLDSNTYLTGITSSQIIAALGYTPVTNARTLTINGTTYDLSANRSWTIEGTAAVWGNISGTLSNQTDLQNALNAKFDDPTGTISQYIRGDGSLATFPTLSGYVPYTGATANVNLGEYGLNAGYVQFDTTPTGTPTGIGTMYWDSANRTVSLLDGDGDTTLQIGQEERVLVHNNTGATLTDGNLVYVTGSTGELPSVALASASMESLSAATLGMVTESIPHGSDGFVTTSGIVHGLNTLAFNEGDQLWLSATAGQFTTTKPISPNHLVLIGYVIKKAGGNGSVFVKIQNTQELDESSDVLISIPKTDGQGLFLQTISGVQLWRNRTIADVLGYTPANDASVVHNTGDETVNGRKTFTTQQTFNNSFLIKNTGSGSVPYGGWTTIWTSDSSFNISVGTSASTSKLVSFIYGSTNPQLTLPSADGTLALVSQLSNFVSGSGSTGYIPKWTSSSVIGSSLLYDDGTSIGYGTNVLNYGGYGRTFTGAGFGTASFGFESVSNSITNNALLGGLSFVIGTNDSSRRIGSAIQAYLLASTATNYGAELRFFAKADAGVLGEVARMTSAGLRVYGTIIKDGGTSSQYLMADGSVSTGPNLSGYITGSGTATRVAFFDGTNSITSSSGLYWDNSAGRLAVGKNSADARLEVYAGTKGQIRANGGTAMGGGVDIYTELSGTGRRNWGIYTEATTPGDFAILVSASAGTAPATEVLNISSAGVGSYKYDFDVVGKLGTGDNKGLHLRGIGDVTHKIYYKTTSGYNNAIWEYNSTLFFQYYAAGSPVTRLSLTIDGNLWTQGTFETGGNVGIKTSPSSTFALITANQGITGSNTYFGSGLVRVGGPSDHGANTVFSVAPGVVEFDRPGVGGGALKIFSDGNIGINQTTNGGYKLDVSGTGRFSGQLTSDYRLGLPGMTIGYWDSANNRIESSSRPLLITSYSQPIYIGQNGSANLTIATSGAATFSSNVTATQFGVADGQKFLSNGGTQSYYAPSSGASEISYQGTLNFRAFNANSPVSAMFMTSNGNVAIGMTSASQRLQVNGRIRVSPDDNNGGDIAVDGGGLAFSSIGSTPIIFERNNYSAESFRITPEGYIRLATLSTIPTTNNTILSYSPNGYMYIMGGSTGIGITATGDRQNAIYLNNTINSILFQTNNVGTRMTLNGAGNLALGDANTPASYARFNLFDTGVVITNGNAIAGTNMKGIFVENTNNGDESIGVWFRTGSNHLSGISGQRDDNTAGWGTDLRFYTHERNTADLTYTRERVRISTEGNLLIGTTYGSFTATNRGNVTINGSSSSILALQVGGSSKGYLLHDSNTMTLQNTVNGASILVTAYANGVYLPSSGTAWLSTSDERTKTDLIPIENALNKVSLLRSVTGRYKTDTIGTSRAFLIAQDVQKVLPEAVNSNNGILGLSYTEIIPLLVASIKELKAELDAIKTQN
jgi:hypothetical protein